MMVTATHGTTTARPSEAGLGLRSAGQRARSVLRFIRWSPLLLVGTIIVTVFVLIALLGPLLTPYPPLAQNITSSRQLPSATHWFGTDELGRDVLSRVIAGARITLVASVTTLALAGGFGVTLGLTTGYWGGTLDRVVMRLVDVQLAIPGLVLALVIIGALGNGPYALILAVAFMSYPTFARVTRGVTLRVKQGEYVLAARCLGSPATRLLSHHVLPNVLPHIMALATVTLGRVVLTLAGLGFLGFGLEPGTPEWGLMVSQGRSSFLTLPHLVFFPGVAIAIVVLGFNLLGDGLRDYLDPRLRRSRTA
jgi:ABC-type dipeptide/oligopeptide/nickel transport system permease subunit